MIYVLSLIFFSFFLQLRREGDSNPRYALGVYTLSRRASSTTRASLLTETDFQKLHFFCFFMALREISYKYICFILLTHFSFDLNLPKRQKLIYFKSSVTVLTHSEEL